MSGILAKYDNGMHKVAWNELAELGPAVFTAPIYDDALGVARKTMQRVDTNLQMLVEGLRQVGFVFTYTPIASPSHGVQEIIEAIEGIAGPIPLSLRACWEIIGAVDLCAQHTLLPPYSDPLVVFSADHALWQAKKWEATCNLHGVEETGPFEIVIAPDCVMKDEMSGGAPYRIIPVAAMDALVQGEPHQCLFVDYIRIALANSGYPGFGQQGLRIPDSLVRIAEEFIPF